MEPGAIENLVYNGFEQELITAGEVSGGTMQYSLEQNGAYSTEVSAAKNAGEYSVWYKVASDEKHEDVTEASIAVAIAPAPVIVVVKDKSTYVGEVAPDLSKPELGRDYTVSGLFGNDELICAPALSYADANGDYIEKPDTSKAGDAAKIMACDAFAGENYSIAYTAGKLMVSAPYIPPTPNPDPKPDPEPDPTPLPIQVSPPSRFRRASSRLAKRLLRAARSWSRLSSLRSCSPRSPSTSASRGQRLTRFSSK